MRVQHRTPGEAGGGVLWRGLSGFAEEDFAVADGEGDFGEGGDVLGGVGVEAFGDVAGMCGVAEALGGISGERG